MNHVDKYWWIESHPKFNEYDGCTIELDFDISSGIGGTIIARSRSRRKPVSENVTDYNSW